MHKNVNVGAALRIFLLRAEVPWPAVCAQSQWILYQLNRATIVRVRGSTRTFLPFSTAYL
jgi:hypothetical protein